MFAWGHYFGFRHFCGINATVFYWSMDIITPVFIRRRTPGCYPGLTYYIPAGIPIAHQSWVSVISMQISFTPGHSAISRVCVRFYYE